MNFTVIPAIDLIDGKVVRLTKGDYDRKTTYDQSAIEWVNLFEENGAKRIHIVDLDGAKTGRVVNESLIREIRSATTCELEFGGGIRNVETCEKLFNLGINYVILGSLLIKDPSLAQEIIERFPNKIIAGIDAKNGMVATEGWLETSKTSAVTLATKFSDYKIESIIYTDIAKDGTLEGPNLNELEAVANASSKPIIASGGVATEVDIKHIENLGNAGVTGAIIGKAILSNHIDISKLWPA